MTEKKEHARKKSLTPYLDKYTEDLTAKVKKNLEDFAAFGREEEIRQVFVSLLRLHKNSPILVGDAGVGKTHIVEGVCAAILKRDGVPKEFHHVRVRNLSLSAITARTRNDEGEEEDIISKLYKIVEELTKYKDQNILFIDEVHTIMGTGASDQSSLDVANLLKPALSRGDIYFISATTFDEFRIIEKDPAMERRLQPIYVEEPDRLAAIQIMERVKAKHERVRNVEVTKRAVEATVDLSIRYIADKNLPDKAIDLLDEAVSNAYLSGQKQVGFKDIARIVSQRKGIDYDILIQNENNEKVIYERELSKVVKGQGEAIEAVANMIYRSKVDFQHKGRPLGSLLFLGTTGVGKTELAKQTAKILFGSESMMTRIDCSEYEDKGSVARLIGKGREKGVLSEAVKKTPYQLLLFDELEKGHPNVHNLLLQILDDGHLTDGNGRKVDFKNTFIIATSNAGHQTIKQKFRTLNEGETFETLSSTSRKSFLANINDDLESLFRPEFLNRFGDKVVLNMLTSDIISQIVVSKMKKQEEYWANRGLELFYVDENLNENRTEFYGYLENIGTDEENGARPLERTIERVLTNPIAKQFYFSRNKQRRRYMVQVRLVGKAPRTLVEGTGGLYSAKDRRVAIIEFVDEKKKPNNNPPIRKVFRVVDR